MPVDVYTSMAAYTAKQSLNLDAWKKTGLGFVELGPGAMYAVTANSGVRLDATAVLLFPTVGVGASILLGYAIGL